MTVAVEDEVLGPAVLEASVPVDDCVRVFFLILIKNMTMGKLFVFFFIFWD